MHFRDWLPCAFVVLISCFASIARAAGAEEAAVYVLSIEPSAAKLDPTALRDGVKAELRAEVVDSDDPRAASAKGGISIAVEDGDLVVSFEAYSPSVSRRVKLPASADDARKTAVALVGNLARDEASELTAELKKPAPAPPPTPTAPAPSPRSEETRMRDAIADGAERDRKSRAWIGRAALGAGLLLTTADVVTLAVTGDKGTLGPVPGLAGGLLGFGIGTLIAPTPFEELQKEAQDPWSSRGVEAAWVRAAAAERSRRKAQGAIGLVLGGLTAGAGVFVLADRGLDIGAAARSTTAQSFFAVAALSGTLGGYLLATEGPVESSLHMFEQAVGRRLEDRKERGQARLSLSPTPGGAMGTFTVTF